MILVDRIGADSSDHEQTFVVVQSGAEEDASATMESAADASEARPPDTGAEEEVDAGEASEPNPQGMRRRSHAGMHGPNAQVLSRAFNARRGEVVGCFRSHPASAPEDGVVQVVITLAPDGAVQNASVAPANVGSTPLGACITQIARTTTFPGQGELVRFRIPVRVTAQ